MDVTHFATTLAEHERTSRGATEAESASAQRRRIDGETAVTGLIGDPVAHSRSPAILNAAFAEAGLNWIYVAFPVPRRCGRRRGEAVPPAPRRPHRHDAAQGRRRGRVRRAHARRDRARRGQRGHHHRRRPPVRSSTDGEGFLRSVRDEASTPPAADVLVAGAGGAARAIVLALGGAGAREVTVAAGGSTPPNRRPRAWCPAARRSRWVTSTLGGLTLVVNATPLGMQGEPGPVPVDARSTRASWWSTPCTTPWRRRSSPPPAPAGCHAVNGLGMLVHQAALAFEIVDRARRAARRDARRRGPHDDVRRSPHDRGARRRVLGPRPRRRVVPRPGDHARAGARQPVFGPPADDEPPPSTTRRVFVTVLGGALFGATAAWATTGAARRDLVLTAALVALAVDRPRDLPPAEPDRLPAHASSCGAARARPRRRRRPRRLRARLLVAGGDRVRHLLRAPPGLAAQHGLRRREAVVHPRPVARLARVGRDDRSACSSGSSTARSSASSSSPPRSAGRARPCRSARSSPPARSPPSSSASPSSTGTRAADVPRGPDERRGREDPGILDCPRSRPECRGCPRAALPDRR